MTRKKKRTRDPAPKYHTASEVARILGISASGVKKHDATLQPMRAANGFRMYEASVVEKFRRDRERARERLERAR